MNPGGGFQITPDGVRPVDPDAISSEAKAIAKLAFREAARLARAVVAGDQVQRDAHKRAGRVGQMVYLFHRKAMGEAIADMLERVSRTDNPIAAVTPKP